MLITAFNLAIFGFYQLGPFLFERLETRWFAFGQSGLVLAAASLLGAFINSVLLQRGARAGQLVEAGVLLLGIGAGGVILLASSPALIIGMAIVALAYAVAIPNILTGALRNYGDRLGTSGAILSMLYYVLLGAGLTAAGFGQRLDILLAASAILAALTLYAKRPSLVSKGL